jgi:putative isomerase
MNKLKFLICCLIPVLLSCNPKSGSKQADYTGNELADLKTKLAKGWNTWDTRSVMTHVLLPEGFAIDLQLKDAQTGDTLKTALVGREAYGSKEHVTPGPHAYDGSYTELELNWRDIHIKVQSASVNEALYLLITPINATSEDSLIVDSKMLWGREGEINFDKDGITSRMPSRSLKVFVNGNGSSIMSSDVKVSLGKPIAISTETAKSTEEITSIVGLSKADFLSKKSSYQKTPELYNAMQTVMAWDLIYEPTEDRVIAPVSRTWNVGWEGWVLFEWDTYFAAYMLSLDNKELAYANAIAMTHEITEKGFVPNFASARGASEDRSEPPVGSLIVKEIYKNHREEWFLQEVFDELLTWNRWWAENRDIDGYLVWGSDPYERGEWPDWLLKGIGTRKGGKWESGLDNSPMWDDAVFDTLTHRLMLADVGLMSLYILDCQSLAEIAGVLGKTKIEQELAERGKKYSKKLETLWDEQFGLYLNKNLVTGEFSYRLSPTLFYPLLAKVPNQQQATRMMQEHFYNEEEFWGDFIMPAIARNDSAYKDNIYWRGRIWAPMNFLVYLGISNYDLPDARKDIVEKSKNLLLKSWTGERHVYENYSAESGRGDDAGMSDKFYHWGALLGLIGIIDEGYMASPQLPLKK